MDTSTQRTGRKESERYVRRGEPVILTAGPSGWPKVSGSRLRGSFATRAGRVGATIERTVVDGGGAMRAVLRSGPRAVALAAVSALVLLVGCTTAQPATSPSPATAARASSPATLEAERDLVVDGRHFKAQCTGQGPSVLLVNSYGSDDGVLG